MFPFFPSLLPPIANKIWFDFNTKIGSDEAEIARLEREHHNWLDSFKTVNADVHPLGKVLVPGPETDDEDANDDSDDSDSHDDEDDDTNDRVIPGQPERSALGLYSPGHDANINEDPMPPNALEDIPA